MKYTFLITITLLVFACKTKKSATVTDTKVSESDAEKEEVNMVMAPPPAKENQSDLVISFYSPGDGINYNAKEKLDKFLSSNKEIVFTTHNWGREGEVDYCFDFKNLNYKTKQNVLGEIKKLVGAENKVRYTPDGECYHKN